MIHEDMTHRSTVQDQSQSENEWLERSGSEGVNGERGQRKEGLRDVR